MIIHPISNLNLGFHEFTDPVDEVLPSGTELVIICGGISNRMKRSLLYCETLIAKYPSVKFILNTAPIDHNQEVPTILYGAMRVRYENTLLNNIYYSRESFTIGDYDILTLVGWPKVEQVPPKLREVFGEPRPRYLSDGECTNTKFRYFMTAEEMNASYLEERTKLQDWLSNDSGKQKLLITGTAPNNDEYASEYSLYEDLDLSGVIWVHAGSSVCDTVKNETRLICNPGRNIARQNTFVI